MNPMPLIPSPFSPQFRFTRRAALAARGIEAHADGLFPRMRGLAHAPLRARGRTRAGRR